MKTCLSLIACMIFYFSTANILHLYADYPCPCIEQPDINQHVSQGIAFIYTDQYTEALQEFELALLSLDDVSHDPVLLEHVATWGKLFAHAYSDEIQLAYADLVQIRHCFFQNCNESVFNTTSLCANNLQYWQRNPKASQSTAALIWKVADFADPNERLTPSECKERVMGTANLLRILALKIPNRLLADAVMVTIDQLASMACRCCERSHWTDCLEPVVDAWLYLKRCMDKGAAIAPYLTLPRG